MDRLGIEPADAMLLIDEAHNCGEVMTGIMNVVVGEQVLAQADREIAAIRRHLKSAAAIGQIISNIALFMQGLKNSHETEDWFDPAIFDRMVVRGSLYKDMAEVVEDLMKISEYIREKNMMAGEYSMSATEMLTAFLVRISCSSTDPGYLTVYRKEEPDIFLEGEHHDHSDRLRDLALSHHCTVLISGTLAPLRSYQRYFFGDLPVTGCSLPNTFPKKNRMVLCAGDITTAFSMRENRQNSARVAQYIQHFARLKGNIAVYFPSYQILDTYARLLAAPLASRNLIIEPKDARDAGEALTTFLSLPSKGKSGILFAVAGGKWSEGLDYRGELLSGAMVIGLPLAPYNQVRKMTIDYFRHKFGPDGEFISYTLPALNRAEQAIGRVLRTPEDRGILVLGEKRFLEPRVKAGLPGWIREEMVECTARIIRGGDEAVEVIEGSARFGLWYVHVRWSGTTVWSDSAATPSVDQSLSSSPSTSPAGSLTFPRSPAGLPRPGNTMPGSMGKYSGSHTEKLRPMERLQDGRGRRQGWSGRPSRGISSR